MQYRVIYKGECFAEEGTQYYNVFHSSEAVDFLAHTFNQGHIDATALEILNVEEFDRFRNKWQCRLGPAIEHCTAPEVVKEDDGIWLRKKS